MPLIAIAITHSTPVESTGWHGQLRSDRGTLVKVNLPSENGHPKLNVTPMVITASLFNSSRTSQAHALELRAALALDRNLRSCKLHFAQGTQRRQRLFQPRHRVSLTILMSAGDRIPRPPFPSPRGRPQVAQLNSTVSPSAEACLLQSSLMARLLRPPFARRRRLRLQS